MKIIKKLIMLLITPINRKLGIIDKEIMKVDRSKNILLETLFNNFRIIGFEPKHIVDVGANRGTWTKEVLKYIPNAHYTLIEPQIWLANAFQDLLNSNDKIKYLPVGAGKKAGTFKFTIVDREDSCSFRYTELEAKEKGFKQIEIPVITLNEMVKEMDKKPFPDLVKIDAEGLDLEVLEGASSFFGKTEVFMVEVSVFSKSFDNTTFKMINFMADKGYVLFDITDLNRPFETRVLWLMELVFIKKDGFINNFSDL